MSTLILHGDNVGESRKRLQGFIDMQKEAGFVIVRLEGDKLETDELESALYAQDMFLTGGAIVIENILSSLRSKRRTEVSAAIDAYTGDKDIAIWEKKSLTAAQKKLIKNGKFEEFKASSKLFVWLDNLQSSPSHRLHLLQETLSSESPELAFLMLARQIGLLLRAKANATISGPPFIINKIRSQARVFSEQKLIQFHSDMTQMDFVQKTGKSALTLKQQLEQLMLSL